jgi:hypothetical protein
MKTIRIPAAAAAALLVTTLSMAQGGPGGGPGMGPGTGMGPGARMQGAGPMASAPGAGMGPRAGRGPGARWGTDYTPGWSLMTEQERTEHQERLRTMTSRRECNAYMAQHRQQMAERAKERGGKALRQPRRDACAGLQ